MKSIFKLIITFLIFNSLTFIANAKTISNNNWLISFSINSTWKVQENNNGYFIVDNSNAGLVALIPHRINNMEQLKEMVSRGEGINDDKVSISPISEFINLNKYSFSGDFSGIVNQTEAKAKVIAMLSPYNQKGVIIVAIEQSENYSGKYAKLAEELAKTIKFKKPTNNSNQIVSQIKKALQGKTLFYSKNEFNTSANGSVSINEKEELSFCSNKTFSGSRLSYSSVSGGDMSSFSGSEQPIELSGTWEILSEMGDIILSLNLSDGNNYKTIIEYKNKQIFINGRLYKTTKANCN